MNYMKMRFMRFIGVGALNTCFGYFFYALLLYQEISPSYALFIATIIGVIFNFQTNRHFVFNDQRGNFFRFSLCYSIIYLFNLMILNAALYFFTSSAYIAQILCLLPTALISYFILNSYSFPEELSHVKKNH